MIRPNSNRSARGATRKEVTSIVLRLEDEMRRFTFIACLTRKLKSPRGPAPGAGPELGEEAGRGSCGREARGAGPPPSDPARPGPARGIAGTPRPAAPSPPRAE